MPNHIIVIFDHSGSMSEGFSGEFPGTGRGSHASHMTKIEEAKEQLVFWISTSKYDKITIVLFSTTVDGIETFVVPDELSRMRNFLEQVRAQGGTNLAEALRLATSLGLDVATGWFCRYLIVTDGLSETHPLDLGLVEKVPSHQGIDAILIDPTPPGERHIRNLCVRGRYIPVYGAPELRTALEERREAYQERTQLLESFSASITEASVLEDKLGALEFTENEAEVPVRRQAKQLRQELAMAKEKSDTVRAQIANAAFPPALIVGELAALAALCASALAFLAGLSSRDDPFSVSLACPRRMSKGYSSYFLVQLFDPADPRQAKARISKTFKSVETQETTAESTVPSGRTVEITLSSAEIDFSASVQRIVQPGGLHGYFWGKPKDTCRPGDHPALLTITDADAGNEYDSIPFTVNVVDYAFDHVSRPLLSKIGSTVAGLASVTSFFLTFLGQIDKTFGLASGSAGCLVAVVLLARIGNIYRNPTIATIQQH